MTVREAIELLQARLKQIDNELYRLRMLTAYDREFRKPKSNRCRRSK